MNINEKYIARCLQLAENGLGTTFPNPMVGAVVTYDNQIIGEGWHQQAGEPHAEVNAIAQVKNKAWLPEATLYVNLEPCSHHGKTPPCSDLIIEKGIKKVVIGMIDPFKKVAGRGIKKLLDAGCQLKVGVLEEDCKTLNKRFFTYHIHKRPYIILKWASTLDGYLSPHNYPHYPTHKAPVWITGNHAQQLVHQWRSQEQAILVGANTVVADNPSLTTRLWFGKNPTRIIIGNPEKLPLDAHVLNEEANNVLITRQKANFTLGTTTEQILVPNGKDTLGELMKTLYDKEIQSLIVEGGRHTLQQFIDAGLWDEARVFTGNKKFYSGTKAPVLSETKLIETNKINNDLLKIYKNDKNLSI